MTEVQRQRCMSRIKGKNTKPELALRAALWEAGLRYRVHFRMKGNPDIVFPKRKVAVFVDGCFWHACPVHSHMPKSNGTYWKAKFVRNMERDERVNATLRAEGWTVLRFWEHEVAASLPSIVSTIVSTICGIVAPPINSER